eukprot:PhM_4_TR3486/c0_g1_i1/m.14766
MATNNICPHSLSVSGCRLGSYCKMVHPKDDTNLTVHMMNQSSLSTTLNSNISDKETPMWWWRENTRCYTHQVNRWRQFATDVAETLESAYLEGQSSCVVLAHRVHFETMTMRPTNAASEEEGQRMVVRVLCTAVASWCTVSHDGQRVHQYDTDACGLIEGAYMRGTRTRLQLRVGLHGCMVNLANMDVREGHTNWIKRLFRQPVRLRCEEPTCDLTLVDEYGGPLYIFNVADVSQVMDTSQLTVKPQGVLHTNEITRPVVLERCPDTGCKLWKTSESHMRTMQHSCPKGKTCVLAVSLPANVEADDVREAWSDLHCTLFHHEDAPHPEGDNVMMWKRKQRHGRLFRKKWTEATTVRGNAGDLRRVDSPDEKQEVLGPILSSASEQFKLDEILATVLRLQSPMFWSVYLRVRQEIAETLMEGSDEHEPHTNALVEHVGYIACRVSTVRQLQTHGLSCLDEYVRRSCVRIFKRPVDALAHFVSSTASASARSSPLTPALALPQTEPSYVVMTVLYFPGWATRVSDTKAAATTADLTRVPSFVKSPSSTVSPPPGHTVLPPVRLLTSRHFTRKECLLFDSVCDAMDMAEATWFDIHDLKQTYPMYVTVFDNNPAISLAASTISLHTPVNFGPLSPHASSNTPLHNNNYLGGGETPEPDFDDLFEDGVGGTDSVFLSPRTAERRVSFTL